MPKRCRFQMVILDHIIFVPPCLRAFVPIDQRQTLADTRQHPQPQHIHLQHSQRVDVVLVPLDDRAAGHCGVLDGDQLAERAAGHDEAADVLGEVAREAHEFTHEGDQPADGRIV